MATTPSPKILTPFHIRNKDMGKETATLFIHIHTRKIDVLISTMLQVEVGLAEGYGIAPRMAGTSEEELSASC